MSCRKQVWQNAPPTSGAALCVHDPVVGVPELSQLLYSIVAGGCRRVQVWAMASKKAWLHLGNVWLDRFGGGGVRVAASWYCLSFDTRADRAGASKQCVTCARCAASLTT
jgi:hypothetical protein